MNSLTSARWDFHRAPGQQFLQLHLVAGGHPDRWWPMLATWRAEKPAAEPPSRVSPHAPVASLKLPPPDHRWAETIIATVLARTVPTDSDADVQNDKTVRGKLLEPFLDHQIMQLSTDWVYTVTDSPACVVARHTQTKETWTLETASAAWGYLKQQAEAAGNVEEVARIASEEMLAALSS